MKYQSLWHTSPKHSEIRTTELKRESGQDCLIKAKYSMISTGTERTVASGAVPHSLYKDMRVPFMEGDFGLPVKYGYSMVGIISNDEHPHVGQAVHLLLPHQTHAWLETSNYSLVPEGIPLKRACLASNVETALTAVWDAGVSVGDRVLICGFGMIGGLVAMVLRKMPALELWIDEPNIERQEIAQSLGLKIWKGATELDHAFHTSSTAAGLQACIDRTARSGKVIELSWYGDSEIPVSLGTSFHTGRKQIIASQVSNLPADRLYRWDYARRKAVVFELLKEDEYDRLLTGEIAFEESPQLFGRIREGKEGGLGWCIKYNTD